MHLSPLPNPDTSAQWDGITPPTRRGGPSRSLTDVLVELGFVDPSRMESAVDVARAQGATADRILLEQGTITQDQLSRATAERHGLDHLDLSRFQVDMAATNLLGPAAATLARLEMVHGRQISLEETIERIEAVTLDEIRDLAREFFQTEKIAFAALGNLNGLKIKRERLEI